jgi:hypothetical protein
VCFLVIVTDEAVPPSPVTIAATASGATIRGIEPRQLAAGTVGEVWVVPDATAVETAARVAITATRGHLTRTVERSCRSSRWPMSGPPTRARTSTAGWPG